MRVGFGYDVHKLVEGRKLIIGGVDIEFACGLVGHSDADVLCHAIMDSLLGAAALGDIGKIFPDSDEKYLNADSIKLLGVVTDMLTEKGHTIVNIDTTIVAQNPKFSPYIFQMRKNISDACGITIGQVSVKATTEEGLGFTGSGEGISAYSVCLID